jgi:hypothetical protein
VYESVRSFCLLRFVVGYVDLLANFYELSEDQLGKVLDRLLREGLIEVRRLMQNKDAASFSLVGQELTWRRTSWG